VSEDEKKEYQPKLVNQASEGNKLLLEVELPPDAELEIKYSYLNEQGKTEKTKVVRTRGVNLVGNLKQLNILQSQAKVAFILSLVVYFLVRIVGIEDFPIYFFSDEAIQSVHAADLIRDQFHSPYGEFLPTFFMNGGQYNLSVSVYAQVLPVLLFGKAIWITRGTAVLLSLLAALGVGLMIKYAFDKKLGWLAILLLSLMPAWFLHSRTAFETSLSVSFYAGFLCFYLLYRLKNPKFLYGAVLFSALAFYSYSPMRVIVGITLLGLFFSDLQYHWQQRKTFLKAFGVGLLCLIPLLRFSLNYPGESVRHLEILGSYWVQNVSKWEKIGTFLQEYINGLNPFYWFIPNQVDLERHLMKGYGHLWQPSMPFIFIGIFWCVKHFRQSFARLVLISLLAAPVGAAIVHLGITRALVMVIPATLLTTIGIKTSWDWLVKQMQNRGYWLLKMVPTAGLIMFVLLSLLNAQILADAVKNGPTWFTNYGLYGMQYGAKQVFGTIEASLMHDPNQKFYLTSTWTNGADVLARYFFDDPVPFEMGSIDGFISEYKPLDENMIFIMVPDEMEKMYESKKFTHPRTRNLIHYPNGAPGFYFVQLSYVDNIDEIFVSEQAARRALKQGKVALQDGEEVQVAYSTLDMGEIIHVFDGDRTTLARTFEANPMKIVVTFFEPRPVEKIRLRVGGEATRIEVRISVDEIEEPLFFMQELDAEADPRWTEIDIQKELLVETVEVMVKNLNNEEPAHVHLWELQFLPSQP